jgi:hypothetical protein
MAALLSSAVTVLRGWKQPGTGVQLATKQLTLVLSGQGDATDSIDASTLGFQTIVSCSNAIKSDNAVIVIAVPSYDGRKILLANLAQGTDGNRDDPANIIGTFRITVTGSTAA